MPLSDVKRVWPFRAAPASHNQPQQEPPRSSSLGESNAEQDGRGGLSLRYILGGRLSSYAIRRMDVCGHHAADQLKMAREDEIR